MTVPRLPQTCCSPAVEWGSPDDIGDRLLRCIVFGAQGNESRLRQLMELVRQDFRDVIMAAEYDELGLRRLRDFNQPFGSAEIIFKPERNWRPSAPEVRGQDVDELCLQHAALAIHFWATWNRVDREMDRSIQNIVDQFAGRLWFVSCEIDLPENIELCQRFGASNTRCGICYSDKYPKRTRTRQELLVEFRFREELKDLRSNDHD